MLINDFNIRKQRYTCGYTTVGMILAYLEGQNIDENYLLENEPTDFNEITFLKLMEVYKKYLKKYKAEIVYGDEKKMTEVIKNSLSSRIPMHIQYLTANLMGDGKPILHYAVLIGYDEDAETFVIADSFGSNKTLNRNDFFEAISFRNECLPEIIKQKYPSNMMIRFTLD